MKSSRVSECTQMELRQRSRDGIDWIGIENGRDLPFTVRRTYHLFDVPTDEARGGHAHIALQQLIVAAHGSFELLLDDGRSKRVITLNRPDCGVHLVPGIWREMQRFSPGAVCLVLASELYDEADYIRDYSEYKRYKNR